MLKLMICHRHVGLLVQPGSGKSHLSEMNYTWGNLGILSFWSWKTKDWFLQSQGVAILTWGNRFWPHPGKSIHHFGKLPFFPLKTKWLNHVKSQHVCTINGLWLGFLSMLIFRPFRTQELGGTATPLRLWLKLSPSVKVCSPSGRATSWLCGAPHRLDRDL